MENPGQFWVEINTNLLRKSTMAASVTPGRALRYAGAPRAASYTITWDTAGFQRPKFVA